MSAPSATKSLSRERASSNPRDVRASVRLADSPSCIVSDESEPSLQMQQMLRAMGQTDIPSPKPTLEINPDHEIVKKLLARSDDAITTDASWLLLDRWKLAIVPQVQPMRALLFTALLMQFLTACAGVRASLKRQRPEAFVWLAAA